MFPLDLSLRAMCRRGSIVELVAGKMRRQISARSCAHPVTHPGNCFESRRSHLADAANFCIATESRLNEQLNLIFTLCAQFHLQAQIIFSGKLLFYLSFGVIYMHRMQMFMLDSEQVNTSKCFSLTPIRSAW